MLELIAHLMGIPHPEGLDQLVLQFFTVRPRLRFWRAS